MEEQSAYLHEDHLVQAHGSPDTSLSWLLITQNNDGLENEALPASNMGQTFYQPSPTAHVAFKNTSRRDMSDTYHAREGAQQTTNDDLFLEGLEDDWTRWLEEESYVLPTFTADDRQGVIHKGSADEVLASLSTDLNEYYLAALPELVKFTADSIAGRAAANIAVPQQIPALLGESFYNFSDWDKLAPSSDCSPGVPRKPSLDKPTGRSNEFLPISGNYDNSNGARRTVARTESRTPSNDCTSIDGLFSHSTSSYAMQSRESAAKISDFGETSMYPIEQPVSAARNQKGVNTDLIRRKKKRTYEAAEREKINAVRQTSACIRCQVYKEPCSDTPADEPCTRCRDIELTAKIWKMPCLRARITEVEIFRTSSIRFPLGVRRIKMWQSNERKTIQLFPKYLQAKAGQEIPIVELTCKRFLPQPTDVLTTKYPTPSGTVTLELPNYALSALPAAARSLDGFMERKFYFLVDDLMDGTHRLFPLTFTEALRHRSKSSMISDGLKISVMTRMYCGGFSLTGEERLDIGKVTDRASPYFGRVPLPPILAAQIDEIWKANMMKRKKKMLSQLKAKILSCKPRDWLEVFLTIFVILSNLEFSYHQKCSQLRRHTQTYAPQQIFSFSTETMLEQWELSAKNIVAHFQVICKGSMPFSTRWFNEGNIRAAELDPASIEYMSQMSHIVEQERTLLEQCSMASREEPLHWVSQLLITTT